MAAPESLFVADRCLVVFVDDTGHEALVKNHPVYGLGGCAVMGRDLASLIREPWKEIRRQVTGAPDTPLHANKFPAIAKAKDIEAVAKFFQERPFWRFGAIITTETQLTDELNLLQTMRLVLQKRINEIVESVLCKEVKIIFESSERADNFIVDTFHDIEFYRGAKRIPSTCYFMPKAAAEPALEVADFVMHAIGRQARQNLKQRGIFVPDFCAVFHTVDRKLTSFVEVAGVRKEE